MSLDGGHLALQPADDDESGGDVFVRNATACEVMVRLGPTASRVDHDRRTVGGGLAGGGVMWWMIGGAAALLTGAWLVAPTLRTIVGPGFQPTRRNDASVFQAQQSSHP